MTRCDFNRHRRLVPPGFAVVCHAPVASPRLVLSSPFCYHRRSSHHRTVLPKTTESLISTHATERTPSARNYRYFPGWTMLGISAAAQFMSAPGQSYSVAAFKDPMRSTLGLSDTDYALAYGFATIVSGALLPWVGRLIDRHGARRILPGVALLLGLGCVAMSQVTGLAGLYLGFSWVRSLGQGALSLISAWLVGEWFALRRGFATAIAGLGGSISVMCFPLLNTYLIHEFGWERAWMVLACMVWTLLMLPAAILVRDRPEDLGLQPDGLPESSVTRKHRSTRSDSTAEWHVFDVIRDRTFWKLLSVPATSGMVGTGLVFHQLALLGSRGVSPGWAMALLSLQAMVGTFAALGAGWLTDRVHNHYLLVAAMALLAGAVVVVAVMPVAAMAILYAVLLGLHGSILRSTGSVVWMTYYGRDNQGAIRGVAMSVMIFGAAVGPLPLALSADYFGNYTAALTAFTAIPLAAGLLVWTVPPPRSAQVS